MTDRERETEPTDGESVREAEEREPESGAREQESGAREQESEEPTPASDSADERLDRRTVLKGTAVAGFAGAGLSGSASAGGWNEITFCAVTHDVFRYHFEASGSVKRGGEFESDSFDEVGEDFASGAVSKERCDSFRFTGDVEKLRLEGPGKVLINGTVVKDTTEPDLPNTITIEAEDVAVNYKFRVSGRVEKGPEADPDDDVVDSNVVRGSLGAGGTDSFRYSGAIAFDEATGPVTVTLDIDS